MMRILVCLAISVFAASAMAERHAVIVAVDKYSFVTAPTQQLRGAQTDASMVKRMLDLYGFESVVLVRADATRAKIVSGLETILKTAKSGDEAVFYFSGRGSIAPDVENPRSKTGMEPTLVPFDGAPNSLDPDIRIRRLEDWAKQLDTRGVHVSVILDCSFQAPTRSDFGRQYHPVPRSVGRAVTSGGEVRTDLFRGPGAFLSACPARGSAYEWLQDSSTGRWSGAFTDQFVNSVVAALNRGENPTYVDAMREAQAYFKDKVRADYMPGLAPQPEMPDLVDSPSYGQTAFGGIDLAKIPPDSKAAIAAQARIQAERERKFRVAVEVMEPTDDKGRLQTYGRASKDLKDYIGDRLVNSEFAPTGAPPDVVVQLRAEKGKITASVTGDDLDKSRAHSFSGKDMKAALGTGLGSYLELRSLVSRLYRITATETATWKTKAEVRADQVALSRGEGFNLDVACDEEAFIFILNRDDADGVLQMAFPQPGAPFEQHLKDPMRMGANVENDSSNGRMMLRAVFVPAKGSVRIPEVDMKDASKFRDSLIRQLRAVVDAIEKKKLEWIAKTINLRIR